MVCECRRSCRTRRGVAERARLLREDRCPIASEPEVGVSLVVDPCHISPVDRRGGHWLVRTLRLRTRFWHGRWCTGLAGLHVLGFSHSAAWPRKSASRPGRPPHLLDGGDASLRHTSWRTVRSWVFGETRARPTSEQ